MIILINGKQAVLDKETAIEYVSENRLFTEADDYTLSIEFPLAGCEQNIKIFGSLFRKDILPDIKPMDCEIIDGAWRKTGALVPDEITPQTLTAQFLSGRSALNFSDSFDDLYIDELDLGEMPPNDLTLVTPTEAWSPDTKGYTFVALPWVNETGGRLHNCGEYTEAGWKWHSSLKKIEWQVYLLHLVEKMLEAIGYTCDLTEWHSSAHLSQLLVCNTLPSSYGITQMARILPHWTVKEFFANIESVIGCEFDFDHLHQRATFTLLSRKMQEQGIITLERVTDEFTRTITAEDPDCKYRGAVNLRYKDRGDDEWAIHIADWFIRQMKAKGNVIEYPTLQNLFEDYLNLPDYSNYSRSKRNPQGWTLEDKWISNILYAADADVYFITRLTDKTLKEAHDGVRRNEYLYSYALEPIGQLAGRIINTEEDAQEVELEILPVRISHTDFEFGRVMYLSPSDYNGYEEDPNEETEPLWDNKSWEQWKSERDAAIDKTSTESLLLGNKETKREEFYNTLYLGFYSGMKSGSVVNNQGPQPYTAKWEASDSPYIIFGQTMPRYYIEENPYSLNLQGEGSLQAGLYHAINPKVKSQFKFLAQSIPDPRSIFIIKGKKYLCEKITATFHTEGMSQLLTGEFYPVVE